MVDSCGCDSDASYFVPCHCPEPGSIGLPYVGNVPVMFPGDPGADRTANRNYPGLEHFMMMPDFGNVRAGSSTTAPVTGIPPAPLNKGPTARDASVLPLALFVLAIAWFVFQPGGPR